MEPEIEPILPSPWQRKLMWGALTALSVVAIGAVAVLFFFLTGKVARFLQPILVPFAIAGVLAYLLDPAVTWITRWNVPRARAVLLVFFAGTAFFAGLVLWVGPTISAQSIEFAKRVPDYSRKTAKTLVGAIELVRTKYGVKLLPDFADRLIPQEQPPGEGRPENAGTPTPAPLPLPPAQVRAAAPSNSPAPPDTTSPPSDEISLEHFVSGQWLNDVLPKLVAKSWEMIRGSIGGFLGVFGFILSLVIVPLYLFYFLTNSAQIAETWHRYLPIRASRFKDEVVDALTEINGYLIAFFRGQLVVALICGALTGLGLMFMGLHFALLIGILICILSLIPYLGILLCWIPAVIIAFVQFQDWTHPLIVTAIFIGVQQIDGLFITPRIVGDSVGLHAVTVIVSLFAWSLLLGGLLGAILAVPLTATLKVLLKRYVWEKRRLQNVLDSVPETPPPTEEAT
jgi:predicted PurR-regulated permease PerM